MLSIVLIDKICHWLGLVVIPIAFQWLKLQPQDTLTTLEQCE